MPNSGTLQRIPAHVSGPGRRDPFRPDPREPRITDPALSSFSGHGLTCPRALTGSARAATGRPRCDAAAVSETGVLLLTRKMLACTANGCGSAKETKEWQVAVPKAPPAPAWAEQMPLQFLDSKHLEVCPQPLPRQPIGKLLVPIIQAVISVPPFSVWPGLTLLDEGLADKVAAHRTVEKSKEIKWSGLPEEVVGRKADASGPIREHVPVDEPRNPPDVAHHLALTRQTPGEAPQARRAEC